QARQNFHPWSMPTRSEPIPGIADQYQPTHEEYGLRVAYKQKLYMEEGWDGPLVQSWVPYIQELDIAIYAFWRPKDGRVRQVKWVSEGTGGNLPYKPELIWKGE